LVVSAYGAGTALPGRSLSVRADILSALTARHIHVPLDAPTPPGRRKAL